MKLTSVLKSKGDDVVTITPEESVAHLVASLAEYGYGALVVSPDGRTVIGIVSERDVVRDMARNGADTMTRTVADIMTTTVTCAPPTATTSALMTLMTNSRVRHVPVLDDDQHLIGIVSIGDVVKSRLGELEDERQALVDYVTIGR